MDESRVDAWVRDNLAAVMAALGLPHWRIRVVLDANEPNVRGRVEIEAPYERAAVILDPPQIADVPALRGVLQHELIHCILAPYDLFLFAAMEYVPEGPAREAMRRVWNYACEAAARNVERLIFSQEKIRDGGMTDAAGDRRVPD